jgi:hypothetical protein
VVQRAVCYDRCWYDIERNEITRGNTGTRFAQAVYYHQSLDLPWTNLAMAR